MDSVYVIEVFIHYHHRHHALKIDGWRGSKCFNAGH